MGKVNILSVSQNISTISTFTYGGEVWPLPQTGQVWLEQALFMGNSSVPGYFCVSMSYTTDAILPLFEFVMRGPMEDYVKLQKELLTELKIEEQCPVKSYADVQKV